MKMDWKKLLSKRRLYTTGEEGQRPPFQRDFDRISFSSAFRRLQDKTQVFPLAESDYVRTRLTHSIESSCVARSLGSIVGEKIIEKHGLRNFEPSDFGAIVAAASLAHDIGNPPLGHSGEDAVQHWFSNSPFGKKLLKNLHDFEEKNDFQKFEGNAQGFRVLTRLQRSNNEGGMQLTCATLAAFMKYPRQSFLDKTELKKLKGISFKKYGFFKTEHSMFCEVAKEVGLIPAIDGKAWFRHPLAFLVEAADDICYTIVDFEDGVRLGYVKYNKAEKLLLEIFSDNDKKKIKNELKNITKNGEKEKLECLRSKVINELIIQVTDCFIENENRILTGEFNDELLTKIKAKSMIKKISTLSKKDIYTTRGVVEIEAAGYEVIGGLLETFLHAVNDVAIKKKKASKKSTKILQLVPDQFLKCKGAVDDDPYTRIIKITDHVSGMTDSFAVSTYKKIKGISLPQS